MLESSHSSGVVLKDMPDEMDKTRMQSPPSYFFFSFILPLSRELSLRKDLFLFSFPAVLKNKLVSWLKHVYWLSLVSK